MLRHRAVNVVVLFAAAVAKTKPQFFPVYIVFAGF
jgi:hypothetical protein